MKKSKNSTKQQKNFKFVGGSKLLRKPKPLTIEEINLRSHLIEFEQVKNSNSISSSINKDNTNTNTITNTGTNTRTKTKKFKKLKSSNCNNTNICNLSSPLDNIIKNNLQLEKLRQFIRGHFITPAVNLDEGRVSQIIQNLPEWDINLMDRLTSNRLKIKLQYPFDSPVYKGPASDVTSIIHNSDNNNFLQKYVNIEDKLQPLESHLLKLFFKYFNPYYTLVHPNYFYFRLNEHWKSYDFQALLSIMLCCSTSYLAIEPFNFACNSSKLAEYYFEKCTTLLSMIDSSDSNFYACKIQIYLLLIYNDYSSIPQNYSEAIRLSSELNWNLNYLMDKEFILNTIPRTDNINSLFNWEENILIWLGLNFHATAVLIAKFPINGLPFDIKLPDIEPALNALFCRDNIVGWIGSLEAGLIFHLYKGFSMFESMRIYNHLTLSEFGPGNLPNSIQLEELNTIKFNLTHWKDQFTKFGLEHQFKQNELALLTLLHLYYHKTLLMIIMPHLPTNPIQLENFNYFNLFKDFLLSSISVSLLMKSQGIWIIIFASGTKNFILSIALSGIKLCLNHLNSLNLSELPQNFKTLKELSELALDSLIKQLTKNFSFAFQKVLSESLAEERGYLFWLNLRNDKYLEELTKLNAIEGSGGDSVNKVTEVEVEEEREMEQEKEKEKSSAANSSPSTSTSTSSVSRPPKLFNSSISNLLN